MQSVTWMNERSEDRALSGILKKKGMGRDIS